MDFMQQTGYLIEQENHSSLLAGAQSASQFCFGNINPRELGKPIGLIDVLNVEDQMQLSSCAGNSITTVMESCMWLSSNGSVNTQLSRMFAYIKGQQRCGITGDRGATLEGCIQAAMNDGCPPESLAQYTGQYYTNFTQAAIDAAKGVTLGSYAPIQTLQELYEFLARRVGGIYLGIPCTQEIFNSPPDGKLDYYYPQRVGGHAICIVDWCEEKDENGYPYLLSPGSWSKRYGYRGYRKIKPSAWVAMRNCSLTSCYGLSEMKYTKPRYDWNSQRWLA